MAAPLHEGNAKRKVLLLCDGEALFREVLRSTGMVGNAGDGSGKIEGELVGIVVGLLQLVDVSKMPETKL